MLESTRNGRDDPSLYSLAILCVVHSLCLFSFVEPARDMGMLLTHRVYFLQTFKQSNQPPLVRFYYRKFVSSRNYGLYDSARTGSQLKLYKGINRTSAKLLNVMVINIFQCIKLQVALQETEFIVNMSLATTLIL